MSTISYTVVDAFTSLPFQGNPAAVVILPSDHKFPDSTLQNIAAEFKLSETAFITAPTSAEILTGSEPSASFKLRWFTPVLEVPLCGHATLASAKVLFSNPNYVPPNIDIIRFSTLSGVLTARRIVGDKVELEFPAGESEQADDSLAQRVIELVQKSVGDSPLVNEVHVGLGPTFKRWVIVNLVKEFDLETAQVDASVFVGSSFAWGISHTNKLSFQNHLKDTPIYGVLLTSTRVSSLKSDTAFISRAFVPRSGVAEDPVTGAAHCLLTPYWSRVLSIPGGQVIPTRQVSPRGGNIDLVWKQNTGTVLLWGESRVVAKGEVYC